MKTAYFNCSSGIAGDMTIAALASAGLDIVALEKKLKAAMPLKGWRFSVRAEDSLYHFPAVRLDVVGGDKRAGSPVQMINMIKSSKLSAGVKENAVAILNVLVKAEAKVHGVKEDKVHFHEIGSIGTIIDITGVCAGLEMMGVGNVFCSAINTGNPAPASLEIIKQKKIPVYSDNPAFELATPTGIAVMSVLASGFGRMPVMSVESSGISAGGQRVNNNVLKVLIGQSQHENSYSGKDEVVLLETNIDDMDPRIYPYVCEKLLACGALDVWLTQVIMKKGRPGLVLSVITAGPLEREVVDIIFTETTTLGIRRMPCQRHILNRQSKGEKKTAQLAGNKRKVKSEYEVIKRTAIKSKTPLKTLLY